MLGLGLQLGTVASALTLRAPIGPVARLAWSGAVSQGVAIPAGTTLVNRVSGATFSTTIAGVTIDNASGMVSGTPTSASGLIVQHLPDGSTHNSLLFAPKTGNRSTEVGANMPALAVYNPNVVFLDYMKLATPSAWNDAPGSVDANGVPQTLGASSGTATYALPYDYTPGATPTPSTYRLITDGDIDAHIADAGNGSYSAFTANGQGNKVATYSGIYGGGGRFVITRINPSQRPTYIHVVREDEAALFLGGTTFGYKQSWVTLCANFSHLRFMKWNNGNLPAAPVTTAASLTYCQSNGQGDVAIAVPLQAQIDLCIVARASAWLTLHSTTTDAQWTGSFSQIDRLATAGLAPPKVEYTNEPWDLDWPQRGAATTAFDTVPGPGSVPTGNKADWYYAYRSAQLAHLTKNAGKPYQHEVCQQLGSNAGNLTFIDEGIAAAGDYTLFTSSTTAPYSQGTWGTDEGSGLTSGQLAFQQACIANQDFDAAIDNMLNDTSGVGTSVVELVPYISRDKSIASARGLRYVCYEFSPLGVYTRGIKDEPTHAGLDAFVCAIEVHELGRGAMRQAIESLEAAGADEVMLFDLGFPPTTAEFGSFGLYGTPALQGALDYLARPYAAT